MPLFFLNFGDSVGTPIISACYINNFRKSSKIPIFQQVKPTFGLLEKGSLMAKWYPTKYPGVRYREHPTRKHGVQKDRYFAVRYTLNGKRYEEALGWASDGWTPQKAAEELARLKRAQRTGEGAHTLAERREQEKARREAEEERRKQEELDALTFAQFFEDKYLPQQKTHKTHHTIRTERSYFDRWLQPNIGDKPLKKITPWDLERLKKKMSDAGTTPKTIEHSLAITRQVLNLARLLGFYDGDNPVQQVKKPKADNRRIRFLSQEEAEELLKHLAKSSPDMHDMALLALHCGPRAGEIFALTWKDVSIEREIATFRHTKNGRVRHIPMTKRVKEMFKARLACAVSDLVFPGRGGKKRNEVGSSFARAVEKLGWNSGVDDSRQKVVFHTLRHTCASWLVMAGVPLYTVKEYLGHQQISQTERYAHLAPDSLQQATSALNDMGQESGKVLNLE